ncbi:MAG TPA: AAA family ATPase [Acidimicrobiales bacterium]|nr:AAA family ATPase [Acidimicrobiales bacterium]
MSTPDPDLATRGQAIFDRLRSATDTTADLAEPDSAEPSEPAADSAAEVDGPSATEASQSEPSEPRAPEVSAAIEAETNSHPAPSVPAAVEEGPSTGEMLANRSDQEVSDAQAFQAEDESPPIDRSPAQAPDPVPTDRPEDPLTVTAPAAEAETVIPPVSPGDQDQSVTNSDLPTPEREPEPAPEPAPAAPPPVRHPAASRPLPRTIAIANQKGGVGKTTTTVNLGAALAELGFRVLVVDLDPQGNATTGLGINSRNLESSIYDVLLHDTALDDCIEPTSVRNLFVAPATIDLAGAEIELVPAFSRELRLRRAIESLDGQFDFTIIDCPPSLGLITVNGLAAATEIIVPIQCEYYALEGLGQLIKNVTLVQGNLNPRLEISAIVLTMYDARTRLAEQVAQEVREHFGDRVCRMVVPRTVRLSEAPSFGQPIITFDPSSRGAIAYRELAKEVSGGAP